MVVRRTQSTASACGVVGRINPLGGPTELYLILGNVPHSILSLG